MEFMLMRMRNYFVLRRRSFVPVLCRPILSLIKSCYYIARAVAYFYLLLNKAPGPPIRRTRAE